jgi:hypothetical protein
MRTNKLFTSLLILIIISSITVTATINFTLDKTYNNNLVLEYNIPDKMEDKTLPDITKFTSNWIEYNNNEEKETKDLSNLYYYQNPIITTTQLSESIDLTGLIIQITESTVTNYIQSLTDFGPRRTGTTACEDAGYYIANVFSSMGLDVRIHEWSYGGNSGNNIEGTLHGVNETSNEVYIVCGHYDSVSGSPGADDNAAGTAAVMACAEVMHNYEFEHTVRFVAFDGEEQGLLGSTVYASEAVSEGVNIVEVFNADMIGYAEDETDRHTVKIYGSANVIASESQHMNDIYPGLIDLTVQTYSPSGNSDHWPFIQRGFDAAMYHEYHFNPYYHSSQDTIENMDLEYDSRVTRMILATLANFSDIVLPDGNGGGGSYIFRPSVNIEVPSTGDYVRGTIDITGKASDAFGFIKYVLVQIDDNDWEYAEIDQTLGSYINWTFSWDTTQINDGSHLIKAVCINNHGADSPTYYSNVNVINDVLNTNINVPSQADINEVITLQSSTTGGIPPYNFTWDLGDGTKKYESNITHSYKHPGIYNIKLTVKDSINEEASASKTIIVIDDIPPAISILKPENAFYINNKNIFDLTTPLIIGDIDIILDASDNYGLGYVVLYIDNQEKIRFTDKPYEYTWDENMFGTARIKVVVYDKSGNTAEDTIEVRKFF